MVPLDRFKVVLDACTLFPMLVRDVLLTLAGHEFFNPKWSVRIRAEWTRNLLERLRERSFDADTLKRVERIAAAMDAAFPDAAINLEFPEPAILHPASLSKAAKGWTCTNIAAVEHQGRCCSHLRRGFRSDRDAQFGRQCFGESGTKRCPWPASYWCWTRSGKYRVEFLTRHRRALLALHPFFRRTLTLFSLIVNVH